MRRVAWLIAAALAACGERPAPREVSRAAIIDLDGGQLVDDPVLGATAGTRIVATSSDGTTVFALVAGGSTPTACGTLDPNGRFVPLAPSPLSFGTLAANDAGLLVSGYGQSTVWMLNRDCTLQRTFDPADAGLRQAVAFDDGWFLMQLQGQSQIVSTAFLWNDGGLTAWVSRSQGDQASMVRSGSSAMLVASVPNAFSMVWLDPHTSTLVAASLVPRGTNTSAAELNGATGMTAVNWFDGTQTYAWRHANGGASIDVTAVPLGDFARPIEGPRLGFMHYDGRALFLEADGGVGAAAPFAPRFAVDGGYTGFPRDMQRFDSPGRFLLIETNTAWSVPIDDAYGVTGPAVPVLDELSSQSAPTLVRLADGRLLATWQDTRNGELAIYARTFDAQGRRLGPALRVAEDVAGTFSRPGGALVVAGSNGGVYDEQARTFTHFTVRADDALEVRGVTPFSFVASPGATGASGPSSGWLLSRDYDFASTQYTLTAVPLLADGGLGTAWRSMPAPSFGVAAFSIGDRHYLVNRLFGSVFTDAGVVFVQGDDVYVAEGLGAPASVHVFPAPLLVIGATLAHVWVRNFVDGGFFAWDVDAGLAIQVPVDDRDHLGLLPLTVTARNAAADGDTLYFSTIAVDGGGVWLRASIDAGVIIERENARALEMVVTSPGHFATVIAQRGSPNVVQVTGFVRTAAVDAGVPLDAGIPVDAGVVDAGPVDAGAPADAGMSPVDAGVPVELRNLQVGCGCSASSNLWAALAYTLLNIAGRRRRVTPSSHARTSDPGSSVARRSERQ